MAVEPLMISQAEQTFAHGHQCIEPLCACESRLIGQGVHESKSKGTTKIAMDKLLGSFNVLLDL